MKKVLRFAFEVTSFVLLVGLVFIGSIMRFVKVGSDTRGSEKPLHYKLAFNSARADIPEGGSDQSGYFPPPSSDGCAPADGPGPAGGAPGDSGEC